MKTKLQGPKRPFKQEKARAARTLVKVPFPGCVFPFALCPLPFAFAAVVIVTGLSSIAMLVGDDIFMLMLMLLMVC